MAAAVAAAIRATPALRGLEGGLDEVAVRLDMAKPALSAQVAAAKFGVPAAVSGSQRAARNFAMHAEFGCGAAQLPRTPGEAKRRGRGGRRAAARRDGGATLVADVHAELAGNTCSDVEQSGLGRENIGSGLMTDHQSELSHVEGVADRVVGAAGSWSCRTSGEPDDCCNNAALSTCSTVGVPSSHASTGSNDDGPPKSLDDFLWCLHSMLVTQPAPVRADQLPLVYARRMGHSLAIERFLVVGEGGLCATLRRIPHIVSFSDHLGAVCITACQPAGITRSDFASQDANYRLTRSRERAARGNLRCD